MPLSNNLSVIYRANVFSVSRCDGVKFLNA